MHKKLLSSLILLSSSLLLGPSIHADERLNVPEGFVIETLPFEVPNARQMALTDTGTLIVGTRRKGVVYAVPNALTSAAPEVVEVADGLSMPSGVTVHKGDLYIGALNKIIRIDDIEATYADADLNIITDALPDKRHHGWKYLKFGPDGFLYVPVGAPCNICLTDDERFATILRMEPDSGKTTVWAAGVRNSVGFAWHPETRYLWFSDNGRDMLGDDVPAEEINIAATGGLHFGYPFRHANSIDDPEFGNHAAKENLNFVAPAVEIQAHSAALGMVFNTASHFPESYAGALFVAEHGSWNRSSKVGYQVSVVRETADGKLTHEPFVTGFLNGQKDWGRPNDVLITPDGSLLVSDDKAGRIYRVSYAPST